MTDLESGAVATGLVTALGVFARWAVRLWAQVRRETIEADDKRAAQQRQFDLEGRQALHASNERMTQALIAQATAQTQLAGEISSLREQLDRIEWRSENTPVSGVPQRLIANPVGPEESRGYRTPGKPPR